MKGSFITFEGSEGSGKSTAIKNLKEKLEGDGYDVVLTREPGGTKLSEDIRDFILSNETDPITEAFLFTAARRQHIVDVIEPALKAGKVVLCDRYVDSGIAYQGHALGVGMDLVEIINSFATQRTIPSLTLFFDIEPEKALERIHNDSNREINRLDLETIEFHEKVYEGYLKQVEKYPDRIKVIDAQKGIRDVSLDVYKIVKREVLDKLENRESKEVLQDLESYKALLVDEVVSEVYQDYNSRTKTDYNKTKVALEENFEMQLDLVYEHLTKSPLSSLHKKQYFLEMKKGMATELTDILVASQKPKTIKNEFESLIKVTLDRKASDIHFTKTDGNKVQILTRSGSTMIPVQTIEMEEYNKLLSYIRFHSSLDLAHPMHPQSGSFDIKGDEFKVSCRISILPTANFHSLVIRVGNYIPKLSLEDLPYFSHNVKMLKSIAEKPAGLILLGGPGASGKSITAYAMIDHLKNRVGNSVITIEDPVEHQDPNIEKEQSIEAEIPTKFRVNLTEESPIEVSKDPDTIRPFISEKREINYDVGIKEILRYDPDVIVIGEIRSKDAAEQAIRASLTGHLVISTIHTKDNLNTIHRMLDLGVSLSNLNQATVALVNQRLVPTDQGEKALMEITTGSDLESIMNQVSKGVVTHLPYETLDEEFLKWKVHEKKTEVRKEHVQHYKTNSDSRLER